MMPPDIRRQRRVLRTMYTSHICFAQLRGKLFKNGAPDRRRTSEMLEHINFPKFPEMQISNAYFLHFLVYLGAWAAPFEAEVHDRIFAKTSFNEIKVNENLGA